MFELKTVRVILLVIFIIKFDYCESMEKGEKGVCEKVVS